MINATGKLFVQYGAGNIGRGFIGSLFSDAGYQVVFVDVDPELVRCINEEGRYPVRIVSREGAKDHWVGPVSAIDGRDEAAVRQLLTRADFLSTSVGANILPKIAPLLAKGLMDRWQVGNEAPLDILICENLMDADRILFDLLAGELPATGQKFLQERVGLVETSIGRMVPVMTTEQKKDHPLLVCVEPYCTLPVDREAFKGELPEIPSLDPQSGFRFFLERKLYLHNMGHAITAYLGALQGCACIHEAIERPEIRLFVQLAMVDAAKVLAAKYGRPISELLDHVDDLLYRFGNPSLADTVLRVGRDPIRKLSPDDRLIGCVRMCLSEDVRPSWLLFGLTAAFCFQPPEDDTAKRLQEELETTGFLETLRHRCGIESESADDQWLRQSLLEAFHIIGQQDRFCRGMAWAEENRRKHIS